MIHYVESHRIICKSVVFCRDLDPKYKEQFDWMFRVAAIEVDPNIAQPVKDRELFHLQNTLFESCMQNQSKQ